MRLFLLVYAQHYHLHHVAHGEHLGGMLHIPVRDLGDMHQAVLMDADVHKRAEINDVPHCAGQHHAGLQVLHLHHVRPKNGLGQRVADIPAGLHELICHVHHGGNADAQLLRSLFLAVMFDFSG